MAYWRATLLTLKAPRAAELGSLSNLELPALYDNRLSGRLPSAL